MRTTVDLPEDVYRQAMAIARDTSRTFSQTVTDLVTRGLRQGVADAPARSAVTNLPVVRLGRVVTTEDVRGLEDDG